MKLYIKKQIFSMRNHFNVYDEQEQEKFSVQGKLFSLGAKLTIYDWHDHEVAYIEQQLFKFHKTFDVYIHGDLVATIKKAFTFLKPKYVVESENVEVQGDLWDMNFTVYVHGHEIGFVSKKWFSFGAAYEVTILEPQYELLIVSIVLAIQMVKQQENHASSSSSSD